MNELKNEQLIRREFMLQWHLTNNCDMRCTHCYIPHSEKNLSEELSTQECFDIVDDFKEMSNRMKFDPLISFTGGNPIMRDDFFEIADYAKRRDIKIGILGNPTSVLSLNIIEKLIKIKPYRYQISLDGIESTHDNIRGKGSFKIALKGIKELVKNDISVAVMATVNNNNLSDIPSILRLSANIGAKVFAFSRLVTNGEGRNLGLNIEPKTYLNFMDNIYNVYYSVKKEYPDFVMTLKDPLWALYFYEKGELKPILDGRVRHGCSVGINNLCLDHDGVVYSCRRLEIPIGNIRESSLFNLFLNSSKIIEHRSVEKIEKCKNCDLIGYCRGCRAIANAETGSYFGVDPQCWKV